VRNRYRAFNASISTLVYASAKLISSTTSDATTSLISSPSPSIGEKVSLQAEFASARTKTASLTT